MTGSPERTHKASPAEVHHLRPGGPSEWTDAAVAESFARHVEGRWLYVGAWKQWMRWDGKRWAADVSEAVYDEARQWIDDERRALVGKAGADFERAARTYAHKSRIDAVVGVARRMDAIAATAAEFDTHHDLLNVGNGIVDLRTGRLHPHDSSFRLTRLVDVDYVPGARHPDVDTVLAAVDPEAHDYLRRVCGYCATGWIHEDVVLILDGTGANGKSTLLTALQAALGDNAAPIDARIVMASQHTDHPTGLASLRGRRLVVISETEEGGRLNGERLKMLSGGDVIAARVMYGDYFNFKPTHKLMLATNHRPIISASDDAVWRRVRLIPFPYTYRDPADARPGDRVKDTRLRARLETGKAQREAMLAWLVSGAVDWYSDGLGRSATITAATDEWRQSQDVMGRFIDERLVIDAALHLSGERLYAEYVAWCDEQGHRPKSNTTFPSDFLQHRAIRDTVDRKRSKHGYRYEGIGTRSRSDDPLGPPGASGA